MPAAPKDDFRIFAEHEHMFFGLGDPFGMIREEIETTLRKQVPDTVIERIQAFDAPKFLTLCKKTDDPSKVIVAHFGFCFRAHLFATFDGGSERALIDAALTFLFCNVDSPGQERCRTHFDLNDDAPANFTDELFQQRFLAFRSQFD